MLVVEDVIDTGLTLHYLCKTFTLRGPRSLAAVTFLDRPYRRLVEDLPVRYVGFTVPDEFFVGYGFDVEERYRNLPDLHVLRELVRPSPSYRVPGASTRQRSASRATREEDVRANPIRSSAQRNSAMMPRSTRRLEVAERVDRLPVDPHLEVEMRPVEWPVSRRSR